MNKFALGAMPLLLAGITHAGTTFDYAHKVNSCAQIDGYKIKADTGRDGIIGRMANFNIIKNSDVKYTLVGTTTQISAKKQYYCEFPDFNAKDCVYGTGSYAFWETSWANPNYLGASPKLVRNWSEDGIFNEDARDFHYKSVSRGIKTITSVVTEKDFKVLIRKGRPDPAPSLPDQVNFEYPSLPYLQNYNWLNNIIWDGLVNWVEKRQPDGGIPDQYAHVPMCDAIDIMVQNAPTVSKKSLYSSNTANSPIIAEVNYSFDQEYSYAGRNNKPLSFTWTFDNKDLPGVLETRTTTVPYISHRPQRSGDYRVTAQINDGTFSKHAILGLVDYTTSSGGGGSCGHNGECENEN